MRRHLSTGAYCAFVGLILTQPPAGPQSSNGRLRGAVQDQTAAVVPAVTIVLRDQATGVETRTVSNEAGLYVFPAIVPGIYTITAEHPAMPKFESTPPVQPQLPTTIDIA